VAETVFDLFHTRRELNKRFYQELYNGLVERMVLDAMLAADKHLMYVGPEGVPFRMSESVQHLPHYLMMNDDIISRIHQSFQPEMKTARDLINRIFTRDFYKFICRTDPVPHLQDFEMVSWEQI
jgi:deoxynucleoside triphosphate triphosphohydrolase SAMHD1